MMNRSAWMPLAAAAVVAAAVSLVVSWMVGRAGMAGPAVPAVSPAPGASATAPATPPVPVPVDLQGLRQAVADLQRKSRQFEGDLNNALKITLTDLASSRTAALDANGTQYVTVTSNSGLFVLSAQKAEVVPGGGRIRFLLGNPMTMVYNGFKLRVRYGEAETREFAFPDNLQPGFWFPFEVFLPGATSEALRNLEVSLETPRVQLYK